MSDKPWRISLVPTTFVLGAGASWDAGYPFAKDMGRGLLQWMEQAEPEGNFYFSSSAASLRNNFENTEDLEVLLAQLGQRLAPHSSATCSDRDTFLNDRKALIRGLSKWFEEIGRAPSNSYRLFASKVVCPGDSVITFNYDVSLDKALKQAGLWEVGDGYGFEVENLPCSSKVHLLKLHGSVNWRTLIFGGCGIGMASNVERSLEVRPVFTDPDLKMLGYDHEVDRSIHRVGNPTLGDSLILPVRDKQFFFSTSLGDEWSSFWDSLWSAAAESLRTSDRVVICGYSVLPIDERACKMLLEDPEIVAPFEVCCGNDSDAIVERLKSSGHNAHASAHTLFNDWLTARTSGCDG